MKIETINYFLSAYLNQDWPYEAKNPDEVIKNFKTSEVSQKIEDLRAEISYLLASNEVLNQNFINKNGGYYLPEVDGLSVREWFERILKILD